MTYESNNLDHKKRNQEYQRRWWQENKDKHQERVAANKTAGRERNRSIVVKYLRKGCADCSESNLVVLEFDHVRGQKIKGISAFVNHPASVEALQQEIDKCEVVCANCHRIRTCERQGGWWTSNLSL